MTINVPTRHRWSAPARTALAAIALIGASGALSGCVAPVGPVEVTRFSAPDGGPVTRGLIRVEPAPGQPDDLELRSYSSAVARELARLGYSEALPSAGSQSAAGQPAVGQVALVELERQRYRPQRNRSPVSVGAGGGTGSFGSGVGLGLGIDLSGAPAEQVATRLSVTIRERPSGKALWEGRAVFTVRADSPLAQTDLGAAKLAEALFKDFPGRSGETVQVR